MIDIKIIGRKKDAGTAQAAMPGTGIVRGSGLTTSDKATEAAYADEAKHAATADEATHAKAADEATHAGSAKDVDSDSPAYSRWLRKDTADTAQEAINFAKGLTAGSFASGSTGAAIYKDSDGAWSAEVDNLTVRRKLQVTELDIQHLRHIGGQVLLSPAEATITEVDTMDIPSGKQLVLRWPARDSEGNEISNDFAVGDQVIAQTFNATTQRYWWRRVWGTGTVGGKHYISVSYLDTAGNEMDCAQGSGIPQPGDKIAVLGNRTMADRQSAIIIAGAGTGSPFIAAYKGIASYTLPAARVYISPAGIALNVDGQVKTLDDVMQAYQADLDDIRAQADEQVVLWFGEEVPTLDNEPASAWTTDDMKLEHIKDIYYNKAAKDNGGRAYSFEQVDGSFMWLNITDKDVLASLEKAERAQDTADGKRRVFVAQPKPPYDPGDLWVNATYPTEANMMVECPDGKIHSSKNPWARNDILRCAGSKAAGESFAIDDWRMAQEVTTAYASEIKQSASDIKLSVTDLSTGLEAAGIHIDGANSRISLKADTTTVSNDLVVSKLKTAEAGARIEASGTMLQVFGKMALNIQFGVDANGYAVLSYYNNNGVKLYDLGPNGLNYIDMSEAKMTPISVCTDADNLNAGYIDWYGFTAKRLNGQVLGDSVYTHNDQDFARQMDGKTFTANSVSEDNLASGTVRIKGQGRKIEEVRDGVEEMQEWVRDNYGIDPAGIDWTLMLDGITLLYPFTIYLVRTYTTGTASSWGEWRVKQPK